MIDAKIVGALRAAADYSSPVEIAELLDQLTGGKLSQSAIVRYFIDAFPKIPLRVLRRAGTWTRVAGQHGSMSDADFNELLRPWLPGPRQDQ
jgi:hypothetical protein